MAHFGGNHNVGPTETVEVPNFQDCVKYTSMVFPPSRPSKVIWELDGLDDLAKLNALVNEAELRHIVLSYGDKSFPVNFFLNKGENTYDSVSLNAVLEASATKKITCNIAVWSYSDITQTWKLVCRNQSVAMGADPVKVVDELISFRASSTFPGAPKTYFEAYSPHSGQDQSKLVLGISVALVKVDTRRMDCAIQ